MLPMLAVAGSFSAALGVTDPAFDDEMTEFKDRIYAIYGPAGSDTRTSNDVIAIANKASLAGAPAIYMDCGTSDGLLESNRALAVVLQKRGFAYQYHETGGAHAWDYWNRRIEAFLPWLMTQFRSTN